MGIKKLNREMRRVSEVWSGLDQNKKLVLDGMSILYYVWTMGKMDLHRILNNTLQYKNVLETFFKSLIGKGFKIELVVFDGAAEPRKLEETVDRQNKRMSAIKAMLNFVDIKASNEIYPKEISNILHPLIKNVFVEKLDEMKIPYYFSDREADQITADEAKKRNAIAVSNDSDYYFFDIPEGYIPVFFFEYDDPWVYKRKKFLEKFNLEEKDLTKIAELMGNDYCKETIPMEEKDRLQLAVQIVKGNEKLLENYLEKQKEIEAKEEEKEQEKEQIVDKDKIFLPKHVLSPEKHALFSKGLICSEIVNVLCGMPFICPVTFEDLQQTSSWVLTRPIRNQIYSFLNLENVKEGVLKNNSFIWENVEVTKPDIDFLNLRKDCKNIFMTCLIALIQLDDSLTDHQIKSLITSSLIKVELVKENFEQEKVSENGFVTVSRKKKNKRNKQKFVSGNFEIRRDELRNCTRESIHMLAKWRAVVQNILMLGQIQQKFYVVPTDILSMTSFHRILKDQNSFKEYLTKKQQEKLENIFQTVQQIFPNKLLKHSFQKKKVVLQKKDDKIIIKSKNDNAFTSLMNEL